MVCYWLSSMTKQRLLECKSMFVLCIGRMISLEQRMLLAGGREHGRK